MDGFQKFMMTDPAWNSMLAGLSGGNRQSGIKAAFKNQANIAAQEESEKAKKAEEAMRGMIGNGITPELINEVSQYDVNTALKLKAMYDEQQKEAMRMQMLQGAFGSSMEAGGAADKIAGYSMASGDTSLLPLATFMQGRENRDIDYQRQLEKELRDEQRKKDTEKRKPATEAQAASANFATRMAGAEDVITPLEGIGVSTANIGETASSNVPIIGNYLTSNEYKKYNQAASDWVRAKLRKESGAVIGEDEMAAEIQTYFPKPGDTPEVIEQKRRARSNALLGVSNAAKPDFSVMPAVPNVAYSVGDIIESGGKKYRIIGGDMSDPDVEPVE